MAIPALARTTAALALGLLSCTSALAHDVFGKADSLWTGMYHLVTSPLAWAALMGLAVSGSGVHTPWPTRAGGLAAAAGMAAAAWPGWLPAWAAPSLAVLLGLCAVFALKPWPWRVAAWALCAGAAAGKAAELDTVAWGSVLGVGATVWLLAVGGLVGIDDLSKTQRVGRMVPLARRVLGSWVAAIGLLLAALAVLGRSSG